VRTVSKLLISKLLSLRYQSTLLFLVRNRLRLSVGRSFFVMGRHGEN